LTCTKDSVEKTNASKGEVFAGLTQVFDRVDQEVYIVDGPTLELRYVNPAALSRLGYKENELVGRSPLLILEEKRGAKDLLAAIQSLDGSGTMATPAIHRTKDGESYSVLSRLQLLSIESRAYALVIAEPIEQHNRNQQQLTKLVQSLASNYDWIAITDEEGHIEYTNEGVQKLTGYGEEEIRGQTPAIWKSDKLSENFYGELWQALLSGNSYRNVFVNRRKDGELFYLDQEIRPIQTTQDGGPPKVRYMAAGKHLETEEAMRQQLRYMAFVDPLTGLPNRVLFNEMVDRAIETHEHFALLFIDVNRFVYINETLGTEMGDLMLKRLALRLGRIAGKENPLARVGDDEFAILYQQIGQVEEVILFADRLRREAALPFRVDEKDIFLSISTGVAIFPDDGQQTHQLTSRASIALAKARRLGRSECIFFKERMNREATEFLWLKENLYNALRRDEFEVKYQPYYCLRTGQMVGMEALARWHSPRLGDVSPARFIPALEDLGLIGEVGRAIAEKVCAQMHEWKEGGLEPVPVSLNISAMQFRDDELVDQLAMLVDRFLIDPQKVVLEVTETTVMEDIERTNEILKRLKEHGFQVAIDDFGTGYSSLSYLSRLPVDVLKIDLSFIRGLHENPEDAAIVSAVISMAHSLDLKTVAEGVESEEHLKILRLLRCDLGQGYLWRKPISADQIVRDLVSRTE
jgi:diguanylate cyclase (GGDEF)-like protein/PAS domain S-box-containing protein